MWPHPNTGNQWTAVPPRIRLTRVWFRVPWAPCVLQASWSGGRRLSKSLTSSRKFLFLTNIAMWTIELTEDLDTIVMQGARWLLVGMYFRSWHLKEKDLSHLSGFNFTVEQFPRLPCLRCVAFWFNAASCVGKGTYLKVEEPEWDSTSHVISYCCVIHPWKSF